MKSNHLLDAVILVKYAGHLEAQKGASASPPKVWSGGTMNPAGALAASAAPAPPSLGQALKNTGQGLLQSGKSMLGIKPPAPPLVGPPADAALVNGLGYGGAPRGTAPAGAGGGNQLGGQGPTPLGPKPASPFGAPSAIANGMGNDGSQGTHPSMIAGLLAGGKPLSAAMPLSGGADSLGRLLRPPAPPAAPAGTQLGGPPSVPPPAAPSRAQAPPSPASFASAPQSAGPQTTPGMGLPTQSTPAAIRGLKPQNAGPSPEQIRQFRHFTHSTYNPGSQEDVESMQRLMAAGPSPKTDPTLSNQQYRGIGRMARF